jgi:SAM-dependent methyltransferase
MEHSLVEMSASARLWGELWGDRPREWAGTEEQQRPVYEAALERVGLGAGDRVLDVGCGTGVFLRLCADRGAEVSGLDASENLLAVARGRVPGADLRHGDMSALPFADNTFDLVTGFTSFFFADDMVEALREAGRVARPGAPVVIEVFGAPERCELERVKGAIAPFRPPGEDGEEVRYWRPGMVAELAATAGLDVVEAFTCETAYAYPDEERFLAAMLAAGGAGAVAGPDREPELRAALVAALAGCRRPDGSYRIGNEWEVVIARAA